MIGLHVIIGYICMYFLVVSSEEIVLLDFESPVEGLCGTSSKCDITWTYVPL